MALDEGGLGLPHPAIGLPRAMFGAERANSAGLDLSNERHLQALAETLRGSVQETWHALPSVNGEQRAGGAALPVLNPADPHDAVGVVHEASEADVAAALAASVAAFPGWQGTSPERRASVLDRAADAMEARMQSLLGLIVREAGKTAANAVAEVREAVDFLRYYAAQARRELTASNSMGLGPVVCISPWNFPLAIFTGQVAAALAAGNTVLAKPAEQTPLIAAEAVRLLHEAGLPAGALQLLPGRGETVGAALVADARIRGVIFTGSTQVARILQRQLAGRLDEQGRPLTLIAETGGQNAMIVDSSALAEQVVADVLASAFDSAGQRCSALRVLCVQEDVADRVLEMLLGAMRELRVGSPDSLAIDVGPVIDAEAQAGIEAHIAAMRAKGRRVHRLDIGAAALQGTFVPPTVIELESIAELDREIFGPVLHVVRWRRDALPALIDTINASGYGLTLGIHTRIDETIAFITARAQVGNQYVNRNIVGAVVGVQPFGGDGLSGTGPKAGGPLYLHRLLARGPGPNLGGNGSLAGRTLTLPGPTGERNTYTLLPREAVLCIADDERDLHFQIGFVAAAGCHAVCIDSPQARRVAAGLAEAGRPRFAPDVLAAPCSLALVHAGRERIAEVSRQLAQRDGPIVGLLACEPGQRDPAAIGLERLFVERTLSVNTAAAGGNASLMTIG